MPPVSTPTSIAPFATPHERNQTFPDAMFLGLRTALYVVPDLTRARDWYAGVIGHAAYFDEPFYVGFNVGGFELGLLPEEGDAHAGEGGVVAYWGVEDARAGLRHLLDQGATLRTEVEDVGGGILVATVFDPFGNVFGVIENPHFELSEG
jgi:predicted enzyme related to lactoylglutathione lyase